MRSEIPVRLVPRQNVQNGDRVGIVVQRVQDSEITTSCSPHGGPSELNGEPRIVRSGADLPELLSDLPELWLAQIVE